MNISKVSSSQIEIIEKNNDYLSFYIKNNLVLSKIIGEFDSNLKEIENVTNTKINLRGNLMIVRGDVKFHTIIFGNICLYVNLPVPIGSPTQILPSSYCKYTNHSFPLGHRREKYNKYSCCKQLLLFSWGTVQVLLSNTLDHFINFLSGLR